jgi:hypothetical protein
MNRSLKISFFIIGIYTIVLVILLLRKGSPSDLVDTQDLANKIEEVKSLNEQILSSNKPLDRKIDSIAILIDQLDLDLIALQQKTDRIRKDYKAQISALDNKSLDSLKIIALEE